MHLVIERNVACGVFNKIKMMFNLFTHKNQVGQRIWKVTRLLVREAIKSKELRVTR